MVIFVVAVFGWLSVVVSKSQDQRAKRGNTQWQTGSAVSAWMVMWVWPHMLSPAICAFQTWCRAPLTPELK